MAKLEVRDLFEELAEENDRLLNDLMISKKCIELMERYRKCLINFNDNCICDQNCEQNKREFNEIELNYKNIENEIKRINENNGRNDEYLYKKRKINELSDNRNNGKVSKKSNADKKVVSEEEENDSEIGEKQKNETQINGNVKFMSENDSLLEEDGNVITKRDENNALILGIN